MNRRGILKYTAALGITGIGREQSMAANKLHLIVPPEETLHEFTFMQWPVNRQVHPDKFYLDLLQKTIADIANTIVEFEPVVMLAAKQHHSAARRYLADTIELWDIPTDDLWCRDSGPLIAINSDGKRVVSHIKFNGWGEKQIHQHDGMVAQRVAEYLDLPLVDSGLKGEAGGIEHNGHGLLMAHESSWVNHNRNPALSRETIGHKLIAAYGAERILWSPGLQGEDITDYHIDSLARFTGPASVIINLPDQPDHEDPFHQAALETHDILVADGLNVDVIPEPNKRRIKSIDFVASYANYYACNGGIIAAQFGDPETDAIAINALQKHYPERTVVTLNVDALGEIGGGIHCATQQMPAV